MITIKQYDIIRCKDTFRHELLLNKGNKYQALSNSSGGKVIIFSKGDTAEVPVGLFVKEPLNQWECYGLPKDPNDLTDEMLNQMGRMRICQDMRLCLTKDMPGLLAYPGAMCKAKSNIRQNTIIVGDNKFKVPLIEVEWYYREEDPMVNGQNNGLFNPLLFKEANSEDLGALERRQREFLRHRARPTFSPLDFYNR